MSAQECVSGWGDVCPGGVHLPPFGQTDACENITFPQLLLRTVKFPTLPILCLTGNLRLRTFGERIFNQIAQSSCSVLHRVVCGFSALINQDHPKITNPEKV